MSDSSPRSYHGIRPHRRFGRTLRDTHVITGTSEAGAGQLRGRVLSAGDLQLIILSLLQENPRHGYQIIKAIQARSHGYYSPSAGMVYPALTYLADLGYATIEPSGAKKLYKLTDPGRNHINQNQEKIRALLDTLNSIGQSNLSPNLETAGTRSTQSIGDDSAPLSEAFRDLKAILFDAIHASLEEQARVTNVLRAAIAEIRGK